MDDDDRPRIQSPDPRVGMAGLLSGESLDGYSLDELDARIGLLEAEIARVAEHRSKASDHMHAADALFGRKE